MPRCDSYQCSRDASVAVSCRTPKWLGDTTVLADDPRGRRTLRITKPGAMRAGQFHTLALCSFHATAFGVSQTSLMEQE